MKIISIQNKREGEAMPKAFISFGRCFEKKRLKTMYGVGVADDLGEVQNGFYVKLEMPFTKKQTYIDHNDFEKKTGPCRLTLGVRARRPVQEGKLEFMFMKIWTPEKQQAGIEPDVAWPRK